MPPRRGKKKKKKKRTVPDVGGRIEHIRCRDAGGKKQKSKCKCKQAVAKTDVKY